MLKFIACVAIIFCSCASAPARINQGLDNGKDIYYYSLVSMDEDRRAATTAALIELQNKISCIGFKELNTQAPPPKASHILYYISVASLPQVVVGSDKNYIGMETDSLTVHTLFIANNLLTTNLNLVPFNRDYYFKIIIHETAHALGMEGHPFQDTIVNYTNLAPSISEKSDVSLSKLDTIYLNNLLCKSNK